MLGMLTAVPALYRWIAIALLAVALFGYGYFKGRLAGEERLQAFVSKVEAEGREAQARAAERTRKAKEITKEVSDAYAETIVAVRADYDRRLRDAYTRARRVPPATPSAPEPHRFSESGTLSDREAELEIAIAGLEKRLAEAATQIEAWKDYGRKLIEWSNARPTSGTSGSGV